MTTPATLRAAAAIVEAAAAREGHAHWARLAAGLHELADEIAPPEAGALSEQVRPSTLDPQLHREEEQCTSTT